MPLFADSNPPGCRAQRGFSFLELIIVITLVVLLFLVAADRLLPLRGQAEMAHVGVVIGTLRSSLGLETARRVINDGPAALPALADSNPMALLQQAPESYLGEFDKPDTEDFRPGTWHFDRRDGTLVYRVRFPQYLDQTSPVERDLRWRVTLHYAEPGSEGGDLNNPVQGVGLIKLDQNSWSESQPRPVE